MALAADWEVARRRHSFFALCWAAADLDWDLVIMSGG